MNTDILNRLRDEFDALDVSAEGERIGELRKDIAKAEHAIERAEARCTAIARCLIDYRGPNGRQVADALLAKAATNIAARAGESIEDLEAERTSLRAGIKDLKSRIEDWEVEIKAARTAAILQAARLAQPLADSIHAEAKQAAEKLLECYAAAYALSLALRAGGIAENELKFAADGVMGQQKLLSWRRSLPVPGQIVELLDKLGDKGDALFVRRSPSAPCPQLEQQTVVIAASASRRQ